MRPKKLTLYKSTALQFLAIVPFLGLGPAAKSGIGPIFFCLILSVLIMHFGKLSATLSTHICRTCRNRRRGATVWAVIGTLVGFGLLVTAADTSSRPLALAGVLLLLLSPGVLWFVSRRDNFALLARDGNEITLSVPDNLPLVWESREPAL